MKITASQYASSLLAAQTEGAITPEMLVKNFLGRLKKRGEFAKARKILSTLEKITSAQSGEERIIIETAHPITEALQTALLKKAQEIFPEKKLVATFRHDESLITGYRIQSSAQLFDNSAQAALKELAQAFKKM
jgi:F0F1-type ATP synthase delta subunit